MNKTTAEIIVASVFFLMLVTLPLVMLGLSIIL